MKEAAIQILIYNPRFELPKAQRGVVINPRLKHRFKKFVPVGIYLESGKLKYYFFEDCDRDRGPEIYSCLSELEKDLPSELRDLFESNPKLFIMGHGNGGVYGLGNSHDISEHIYDDKFNTLITEFKEMLPKGDSQVFITLEGCNTDSLLDAKANQQVKTFLERVSLNHSDITFSGTGPWDELDGETGFRSLSPNVPATSIAGNVWKAGNSVIFFHDDIQIRVRKSLFASTPTAKATKINTIEYAKSFLGENDDALVKEIALRRDILTIEDLKKVTEFPASPHKEITNYHEREKQILSEEQARYISKVTAILDKLEEVSDRDILIILLGLKSPNVFDGNEHILESILQNEILLKMAMVSCGKVLIGGPTNDELIDKLVQRGVDVNSVDKDGKTALHYAVESFYNFRKEPLALIMKLLDRDADVEKQDIQGRSPIDLAKQHANDNRVTGIKQVIAYLQKDSALKTQADIKKAVMTIFQMSQHKVDELRALPMSMHEYSSCEQGTLYVPDHVGKRLFDVLSHANVKLELLNAFNEQLNNISVQLRNGDNTGTVFDSNLDLVPKKFSDLSCLEPVMKKCVEIKQQLLSQASKDEEQGNTPQF
jgi:hypothetical protein